MYNQEDEENYNANVAASPLMLLHCSSKEGRLQKLYEFPESANILSSTSVYIKIIIIIIITIFIQKIPINTQV
jgi:hypothetical protein